MFASPKSAPLSAIVLRWLSAGAIFAYALGLLAPAVGFAQQTQQPQQSLHNAPMIFDVRRSLPLEPDEPVYHDFYINAGAEAGFKKGMFVTAIRMVPVHDPVQNKQQAELQVGVARLQVIYTARSLTVARLDTEFTDEERPTLEYESVMIGDRIDPESGIMDTPHPKKKKTANGKKNKADDAAEAKAEVPASVPILVPVPAHAPEAPSPPQAAPPPPPKNTSQPASPPDMLPLPSFPLEEIAFDIR